MEKEIILSLTANFEDFVQRTEDGVEFWLARDLQELLGYSKWSNFVNVIAKAKNPLIKKYMDLENILLLLIKRLRKLRN